jgi:hypothetical protein
MPTTELSPFISPVIPGAVSTSVISEVRITPDYERQEGGLSRWQALIEDQLLEWDRDPSQLEDDETQSPSRELIARAISLASLLRRGNYAAPTRIVPDAHGGIVFELQGTRLFESIRLSAEGSAEYCEFVDNHLVNRRPLMLGGI